MPRKMDKSHRERETMRACQGWSGPSPESKEELLFNALSCLYFVNKADVAPPKDIDAENRRV